MKKPVCAVVGVGPGNGAALARRFAAGGYAVALMARGSTLSGTLAAELDDARAYECDVADATSVSLGQEVDRRRRAAPAESDHLRKASVGLKPPHYSAADAASGTKHQSCPCGRQRTPTIGGYFK